MPFSSLSRFVSASITPKPLKTTALPLTTLSTADEIYAHLIDNSTNMEKTLTRINPKLDANCVNNVMLRCLPNHSQLGLRFFIWAGLQSSYRHSGFIYSKASELFTIKLNPKVIRDVVEGYRQNKCVVNVKMVKVVLNLCREARIADEALWVLRKMSEFNLKADTTAYNVVIRLFSEKGHMDVARKLMGEMTLMSLYPDILTYLSIIKGFCNVGRLEEACGLIKVMRDHGCVPNVVVYSTLIDGVCRSESVDRALELLREMEKEGGYCSPNVVTYTSIVQSFCENGRAMEAVGFLDRVEGRGCTPNRVMAGTLIHGLCVQGHVKEAYEVVDKVVARGGVSYDDCYSSLVVSLIRIKRVEEAERLFRKMLAGGLKPSSLACSIMMKEICLEGRMLDGLNLCVEVEKIGCLALIDSDVYSIILVGLCQKGHSLEAAELARLMLGEGIQLKAPYVDQIVKYFTKSEYKELVTRLHRIGRNT